MWWRALRRLLADGWQPAVLVGVGGPLTVGVIIEYRGEGSAAALGGLSSFYGSSAPRWRRAGMTAASGIGLCVVAPVAGMAAAVALAGRRRAVRDQLRGSSRPM